MPTRPNTSSLTKGLITVQRTTCDTCGALIKPKFAANHDLSHTKPRGVAMTFTTTSNQRGSFVLDLEPAYRRDDLALADLVGESA